MRTSQTHTLSNGIRLVHSRVHSSKIVHCGIMLDIGSRDETPANQGIAHFWEHMAFKGTRKRKAFHIINRLESIGGELNAFTDKEKILFYASLRDVHFEKALELLADITFNSTFPDKQIDRERHVILEEMAMYHDDPEDSLQDEFDTVVFSGHALGMNILGTKKTVGSFRRKHFLSFIKDHLDTRKVVVSIVGNLDFEVAVKLVERHLGGIKRLVSHGRRRRFSNYKPKEMVMQRTMKQARCAIGRPAYSLRDQQRIDFYLLTNILGGAGMNSRLNMALREKHGFVYSVGAQFVPFTDTGLFVISFGTDVIQLSKSIGLVKEELRKLRDTPLGIRQLKESKEQMLGQLAMGEENNLSFMMMMARSTLDVGKVVSTDELSDRIRQVDAASLNAMAYEMFNEDQLSFLIMEPVRDGISK